MLFMTADKCYILKFDIICCAFTSSYTIYNSIIKLHSFMYRPIRILVRSSVKSYLASYLTTKNLSKHVLNKLTVRLFTLTTELCKLFQALTIQHRKSISCAVKPLNLVALKSVDFTRKIILVPFILANSNHTIPTCHSNSTFVNITFQQWVWQQLLYTPTVIIIRL